MVLDKLLTKKRLFLCATASIFVLGSMAASADTTFVVNSTADDSDISPGDGVCQTSASVCTLRAAIEEANGLAGEDTVEIPGGIYHTDLIYINDDINIIGGNGTILEGQSAVGDQASWLFDVRPSVNNVTSNVTISKLTIQNFRDDSGAGAQSAVTSRSGSITKLIDVVVTNNYCSLNGGGVSNSGKMYITNSEISHNSTRANALGANGRGGGIFNTGTIEISGSLIYANFAGKGGGLIMNGGQAKVSNTTFSENTSLAEGGGIGVVYGRVDIVHSTITKNKTALGGEAVRRHGGGIYAGAISGRTTALNISNSIVADNVGSGYLQSDSVDCYKHPDASLISYGNNIIGELTNDCDIVNYENGDLTDILYGSSSNPLDPKLSEELVSLAGEPASYPLLEGSPALDAVVAELPTQHSEFRCTYSDQRGVRRMAESVYGGEAVCDIGAYEERLQTTLIEAEDADLSGALVSGVCYEGSGGQCVSAYGQSFNNYAGANDSNRMMFSAYVDKAGYYSLDAWVQAASLVDDSFYVSIDGEEPFIWDTEVSGAEIKQQRIVPRQGATPNPQTDYGYYFLGKGSHTIEFFLREGGTVLDRIAITQAASQFGGLLDGVMSASSEHVTAFSNTSFKFYSASYANDQQQHTEWRSHKDEGGSAWIELSLQEPHVINTVVLDWSAGYHAATYDIQVSNDGFNWQTVYSSGPFSYGGQHKIALSGTGKYIRMQGISFSIWSSNFGLKDFRVYGTPLAEPAEFDMLFDEIDQNFFPYASGTINNVFLKQGQNSFTIDLDSLFTDPDGESLNFNKDGSNRDSPNVSFTDASRKTIRIEPTEIGTETFEIIASDSSGEEAVLTFEVTVLAQNTAPTVVNPIADRVMYLGQPCQTIDMDTVFKDNDNSSLTYNNNTNSLNGNFLGGPSKFEICTNRIGEDTFDITATDAEGAEAVNSFTVRVEGETSEVQPEQMTALNATIDNNHSGYTGAGFLNTENAVDTWFEIPIVVTNTGSKVVDIYYANGSTARPLNIYLNGEYATTIDLPGTGSWSNWSSAFTAIEVLEPGFHILRFEATTAGGAPNIDKIEMGSL